MGHYLKVGLFALQTGPRQNVASLFRLSVPLFPSGCSNESAAATEEGVPLGACSSLRLSAASSARVSGGAGPAPLTASPPFGRRGRRNSVPG